MTNRSYAAAHFALELDGKGDAIGLFRSIEGGSIKAEVMTYQHGGTYDRWRQLGKPKFEDIKVQVGMSMTESFYKWVEKFVAGEADRKNGAIVAADFYYAERARREFTAAMIKELTFPKLDGADKNAAYMTVALAVEGIEFKKGGGQKLAAPGGGFEKQKLWTSNNFRLKVDGLEQACRRVSKVDSFTIKQNIIEYHGGGMRAPTKSPSQMEFPSITFYVPEADAAPFFAHMKKRGVHGEVPGRLNGMLETFDSENRDTFRIQFYGCDLSNVAAEKSDATSEEIKLVKIEMYVERMTFHHLNVG